MNKMTKRMIAAVVCLLMLLVTGCGGGNSSKENGKVTLHVASINKGYGIVWLENMLKAFCEKNDIGYEITPFYDDGVATQKIEAGAEACNYDLVFSGQQMVADAQYLMDLSDVLATTIESGDRAGKTIAECIDETVYDSMADTNDRSKFYRMPWTGGVNGLLYNQEAIAKVLGADWMERYPCRTTDELLEFCKASSEAGLAPFIHSATTNYYMFLYNAWFAQYNGTEGLHDYFNGSYYNFLGEKVVGYDVAHNAGVLESIKVMDSIFGGGYSHEKSNSIDWEVTQTLFMTGEAAMFANGDWHHREMMKQFPDTDVRFLKVPMISALGTKLGINDEQLAALVDYVDGNGEKPSVSTDTYTTEQLIEIVADARSWVASYADFHNVFIPVYSDNAELAKEFLKFMVSDEGQHIFSQSTGGLTMCYGYDLAKDADYASMNEFAKSRWEIAKNAKFYVTGRGENYSRAGLEPFGARSKAPIEVLLSRKDDRYTVEMVYEFDYEWYKQQWPVMESAVSKYPN